MTSADLKIKKRVTAAVLALFAAVVFFGYIALTWYASK
jgi:uncharacterized membrane protein (DUF485 family)